MFGTSTKTLQVPKVSELIFVEGKPDRRRQKQQVAPKRPLSVVEVVRFQHDGSCSKTTKPGKVAIGCHTWMSTEVSNESLASWFITYLRDLQPTYNFQIPCEDRWEFGPAFKPREVRPFRSSPLTPILTRYDCQGFWKSIGSERIVQFFWGGGLFTKM